MPERPKVGVFICHCGTNIAGVIDVKKVAEQIGKIPDVEVSTDYLFMCSEAGQKLIKEHIKKKGLNRIVVAACSPKLHGVTFRKCVSEANLNPYFLEMCNIREQCSWPHMFEKEKATEKAIKLVSGVVEKAKLLEPIESIEEPVEKSALVIGGGIAGIQAALDLANNGIKVYLVEKSPSIGGNMARLEKTFPTNDCAMCILSPKMNEVRSHPNIEILSYSEVLSVDGYIGNFQVKILKKPRYVDSAKCTGCGLCAQVCPVQVPSEWELGMGMRKAIYLPFPQSVPLTYTIDREACIECGLCESTCLRNAIDFEQKPEEITLNVGAIIIATGWQEWDPSPLTQYGYKIYPNVITQMQLAQMLEAVGPTKGKVIRADGKPAKKIVMIQCVGSRDVKYNSYCSSVCCMAAIKNAQLIKLEHNPDAEIYICYIDIRAYRKSYEEYYQRAREYGITFIRGNVAKVYEHPETGMMKVNVYNTVLDKVMEIDADLVVLSTSTIPSEGTDKLAHILGVDLDSNGFIKELHVKLNPVDTKISGIYVCGSCQGPKDISDSISQASAAAARALIPLSSGKIKLDLLIPEVNEELCINCGICVETCPYDAVKINEEKGIAEINPLKCRGCGSCCGECPTGALQLKHYRDDQISAQIKGMLKSVGD
ncbi:MAG: 4Fe-4S dicluster domain-containing protein [Candidatus Odinarchaeia archaeon]